MPADKQAHQSEKRNQQSETFPQFQPLIKQLYHIVRERKNNKTHYTTSKAALQHHGNLSNAAPKSPGDDQGTTQIRFLKVELSYIPTSDGMGKTVVGAKKCFPRSASSSVECGFQSRPRRPRNQQGRNLSRTRIKGSPDQPNAAHQRIQTRPKNPPWD